jgi:hypothetical protein
MLGLDLKIVVALISAFASLVVAVVTYFATRSNQRDIEDLKAELLEKKAERDALRDYEYEARKRLYHECAPLMFQLLEQAEGVLNRVRNLARTASQGNLEPGQTWLSRKYYRLSTMHRFLEPLATLKLVQNRLTLLDLSLDPYLYCQYSLAKQIYYSFADDFDLRKATDPPLDYDPHSEYAESERATNPKVYWQQGVPIGILDNAVHSLITNESEGASRVLRFAEFESEYDRKGSAVRRAFDRIGYLFEDFHPRTRPVLWRILISQAALYRALLHTRSGDRLALDLAALATFPRAERGSFDWRMQGEQVDDAVVLDVPFDAAGKYLSQPIARLVEKLTSRGARA